MPLSLLLPMVILGIAGIALLLHVLGLSRPALLANAAAARSAWLREFPDDAPGRITLSHDNHAALIETAQGHGVVWPMGADTAARYLTGAQITRTEAGLSISLPDYTAPRIRLRLGADELESWPALMERAA